MDRSKLQALESLLRIEGGSDGSLVPDCSILSCGCLVSESYFMRNLRDESEPTRCPVCGKSEVVVLSEIKPLRELYKLIQKWTAKYPRRERKRSSARSNHSSMSENENEKAPEYMDLMSLAYEVSQTNISSAVDSKSTAIQGTETLESEKNKSDHYKSVSPIDNSVIQTDSKTSGTRMDVSDEFTRREYNFSKCFPLYKKLSVFQTQQIRFNLLAGNPFKGNNIIKPTSFLGNHMYSYIDHESEEEVTRFVLLARKRWELYEYVRSSKYKPTYNEKPVLICCGKSTGQYGKDLNSYTEEISDEVAIKNDFSGFRSSTRNSKALREVVSKKLKEWEFIYCKISKDLLVIYGTKGVMRVFNISRKKPSSTLGKPLYTYITDFPIRCVSISPNEKLIASAIMAKERVSNKEQPFIILHKLYQDGDKSQVASVEPITITLPHRDPIKLIAFNKSSTHLLCCTSWESTVLIIRLYDKESDDYKRPRLIWSENIYSRRKPRLSSDIADDNSSSSIDLNDNFLDELITDLEFSSFRPDLFAITFSSLQNKYSAVIQIHSRDPYLLGEVNKSSASDPDIQSFDNINNSMESSGDTKSSYHSNVVSSEILTRLPEIGSTVHRVCISPRGDGMAFVDKSGRIYLVSTPNSQISMSKRISVQLGEAANADRFLQSASINFSPDGGKVFAVDRKGVFQVFDFTKGIPGVDTDVIKCKLLNTSKG
ncbi:Piso0_004848 [Millerozyma farinosa CBS 7064]|uniref:Piso0_004848 protein n=1 Tax=Pichia sorbitophila (strain ATCC MYA-4447 / BCRC 22081 / CBS 7064 / NBRC 10061 / NRRL Y-12695) TaxID=559304 RepID=G8Y3J8_PICSO|nr:Piso0_004848 [Millerozyma farinosa CBS 7064]